MPLLRLADVYRTVSAEEGRDLTIPFTCGIITITYEERTRCTAQAATQSSGVA